MSTSCGPRTTAQHITKRMAETGRTRSKNSIYSVILDGPRVICHTEATLDVWWHSLKPEDKAALYELHLEGALDEPVPAITACNLSPKALERPEFVACLAEVARAGQIMLAVRKLVNDANC